MNFKLIILSPEHSLKNETLLLQRLFRAGLKFFHLRKPAYSYDQLRKYLNEIPKEFHSRIIIHSHYKLLDEFQLKGIHLPENSRKDPGVLRYIRKKRPGHVSASFHSLSDLKRSKRNYAYVFLSPVFDSISKEGHHSGFDPAFLKEQLQTFRKKQKVIALGGVTEKNIKLVRDMGFSGAAMLGHIWRNKIPEKNFRKCIEKLDEPGL
ncbi:MAG: thiamine phosphate synthase [Bacteroidia bacterium]